MVEHSPGPDETPEVTRSPLMNTLAPDLLEVNLGDDASTLECARPEVESLDSWLLTDDEADRLAADSEGFDRYMTGAFAW